jgi:hypothetical protein
MDIHKPKPWRGFREFLKEYIIIVVGVLTALAAEAVVQEIDWARRVHDAETDMRRDLEDDARISFERMAMRDCNLQQIEARQAALVRNRDQGAPVPLFPQLQFGGRILFYETWQNARSLQLTGHIPTERLRDYGRAFHLVENIHEQTMAAAAHLPAVQTLSVNAGAISPAERDRLFLALQTVEADTGGLDVSALRFLEAARRVGVEVSAADKARILGSMSDPSRAGPCVADPTARIERSARGTDWFRNAKAGPP